MISGTRYDAMARLMQGDGICGAVCPGAAIWIATNHRSQTALINAVQGYMTAIAHKALALKEGELTPAQAKIETDNERKRVILEAGKTRLFSNPTYKRAFNEALDKVTNSIFAGDLNINDEIDQPFEPTLLAMLRNGEYNFIPGKENEHAELKVVHAALSYYAEKHDVKKGESVYVGVSKKCCKNCACLIEAIQEVLGLFIEKHVWPEIATRGNGHGYAFRSAIPTILDPAYPALTIEQKRKLHQRFLEKVGVQTIEAAFNPPPCVADPNRQLHTPSPPIPIFSAINKFEATLMQQMPSTPSAQPLATASSSMAMLSLSNSSHEVLP